MSTTAADIQPDAFTESSGFIGNFKLGDNVNHTLAVLSLLYETQRRVNDSPLLSKPIIFLIGSVCEAILFDLLEVRAKQFTGEGISGIERDVRDAIRGSHIDTFSKYIACIRKHNLLEGDGPYDSLEELRKLRNRIHIQNEKGDFQRDDGDAFTMARQRDAEKTLEKLIKTMADRFERPLHTQGHVEDFRLPWREHFPTEKTRSRGTA